MRLGVFIGTFSQHVLNYDLYKHQGIFDFFVPFEDEETTREKKYERIIAGNTVQPVNTEVLPAEVTEILQDYSSGRLYIFENYFRELNMTGHKDASLVMPNGYEPGHAHNEYLQFAYSHGIVAGLLFIAVIVVGFARGLVYFRKNSEADFISATFPALIILAVASLAVTEVVFQFSSSTGFLLMLVMAPLLYFSVRNKKQVEAS
jgi:hypothetical protein